MRGILNILKLQNHSEGDLQRQKTDHSLHLSHTFDESLTNLILIVESIITLSGSI